MTGPVEIAAEALNGAQVVPGCCPNCIDRACERVETLGLYTDTAHVAREVLGALHAAGWRIVRLGAEWAQTTGRGRSRREAVITEEWTP